LEGNHLKVLEMMPDVIKIGSHENVKRQFIVALFISVLFVVPVMWMLMDRSPPYTFEHVNIIPHNTIQGGDIYITFRVKINRPACGGGVFYREFKEASGKLHLYDPIAQDKMLEIVDNKFTRINKLPDDISPGLTFYRSAACYTCNPIHSWLKWPVCIYTPSVEFNVLRKPT